MTDASAHKTFDFDSKIPPLPVPSLEDTAARYLVSIEPLVDAATLARNRAEVAELLAPDGVGRKLHALLLERAAKMDNWLSGWWEQAAYLTYQEPLIVNSNIGISTDARVTHPDQAMRAAQLTADTINFYFAIVNETMPPEILKDGSAFDMSLLKRFFATNRFPGATTDRIHTYGFNDSRHVLVIRRGHYYVFDVIDINGKALPAADIMAQFKKIIAAAEVALAAAPVGLLTADHRAVWHTERDRLSADPVNGLSLDRIDRALFLVCLDDASHDTFEKLAKAGLYGIRGSRWYDKSFALVVDTDGRFTLHGEHSPVDAGAWIPLIETIGGKIADLAPSANMALGAPVELTWNLKPETLAAIDRAGAVWDKLTGDLDQRILHYTGYGKDLIKTFKTGPDPLLQMSFQLAYLRMHGKTPKIYEAASTRAYRGGRTETIRSATNASRAFCLSVDDPALNDAQKNTLMRAAFTEHGKLAKDAAAGQGCDRHLLGLRLIAAENGVADLPALFSEEVYKRGWELSTAQLPMKVGFVNHFGPVTPEGYGIAYIIKDDHINVHVTSFKSHPMTDSGKYLESISKALDDIGALGQRILAAEKAAA